MWSLWTPFMSRLLSGRRIEWKSSLRHFLSTNCNGVPEPWQFMEIVEHRIYVGLLSFRRQLMVDADHVLVGEDEGDFLGGYDLQDRWWTGADWFLWHLESSHKRSEQKSALIAQIVRKARACCRPPLRFTKPQWSPLMYSWA